MPGFVDAAACFGCGACSRAAAAARFARFLCSHSASAVYNFGLLRQAGWEEARIEGNVSMLHATECAPVKVAHKLDYRRPYYRHSSRALMGRPTYGHHLSSSERSLTVSANDGRGDKIVETLTGTHKIHGIERRFYSTGHRKSKAALTVIPGEVEHLLSSQAHIRADTQNENLGAFERTLGGQERPFFYQDCIDKFCKHGQVSRALDLLEEMYKQKLSLTPLTFIPILLSIAQQLQLGEALELLAAMRRMGIEPALRHYNIVLTACVNAGNMEKACGVVSALKQHGKQPNRETFNEMIRGFCRQKRFKLAKSLLRDMEKVGCKPNVRSYRFLLQACAANQDSKEAMKLVKEMKDRGLELINVCPKRTDVSSIDSGSIDDAVKAGCLEEADRLYREMRANGNYPRPAAAKALLVAYGNAGELDRMVDIVGDLASKPLLSEDHVYLTGCLTDACMHVVLCFIQRKQHGQAAKFLQRLSGLGSRTDGVLIDKFFIHTANSGASVNDCLSVLKTLRELGIRPSRMALEGLLDGCASEGHSGKALEVLQEMEKESLQLNIFSKIRLFQIFMAAKNTRESRRVLAEMSSEDLKDADVQFLVLQVLQLHRVEDSSTEIKAIHTLAYERLAACN